MAHILELFQIYTEKIDYIFFSKAILSYSADLLLLISSIEFSEVVYVDENQ